MQPKVYTKELKLEIIEKIKSSGKSVTQIAQDYAINPKNIYNWLRAQTFKDTNVLELNKLKREKEELLIIIGKMQLELTREKKDRYGKK